jgi:hypothetical protein
MPVVAGIAHPSADRRSTAFGILFHALARSGVVGCLPNPKMLHAGAGSPCGASGQAGQHEPSCGCGAEHDHSESSASLVRQWRLNRFFEPCCRYLAGAPARVRLLALRAILKTWPPVGAAFITFIRVESHAAIILSRSGSPTRSRRTRSRTADCLTRSFRTSPKERSVDATVARNGRVDYYTPSRPSNGRTPTDASPGHPTPKQGPQPSANKSRPPHRRLNRARPRHGRGWPRSSHGAV